MLPPPHTFFVKSLWFQLWPLNHELNSKIHHPTAKLNFYFFAQQVFVHFHKRAKITEGGECWNKIKRLVRIWWEYLICFVVQSSHFQIRKNRNQTKGNIGKYHGSDFSFSNKVHYTWIGFLHFLPHSLSLDTPISPKSYCFCEEFFFRFIDLLFLDLPEKIKLSFFLLLFPNICKDNLGRVFFSLFFNNFFNIHLL